MRTRCDTCLQGYIGGFSPVCVCFINGVAFNAFTINWRVLVGLCVCKALSPPDDGA